MKIKVKKISHENVEVTDEEILNAAAKVIANKFDIDGCFLDREGFIAYDERNYEVQVRKALVEDLEAFRVIGYLRKLSIKE